MDAASARRANLIALIAKHGTIEILAELTDSSASHLSQIKNGERNMGAKVARRIETKLNKTSGWMDSPHEEKDGLTPTAGPVDPTDLSSLLAPRRRRFASAARELTPEQMEDIVAELHEAVDHVLSKMDGYKRSNEVVMKTTGAKKPSTVSAARARDKLGLPPTRQLHQKPLSGTLPLETPDVDDRTGDLFDDKG